MVSLIRKDGSFVVRNDGGIHQNYFDKLYSIFEGQNEEADSYIDQLTAAMNANEDYSVISDMGYSQGTPNKMTSSPPLLTADAALRSPFFKHQLTAAMNANEDYSVILKSGESRHHLYCTSLPYCEWYLWTWPRKSCQ